MADLERQFKLELEDKMRRAKKECQYNPTRFNQMLAKYGAVETAKRLISHAKSTRTVSDGFTTLYLCGRLDLTVEHSVCKEKYRPLFSPDEIAYCEELLKSS